MTTLNINSPLSPFGFQNVTTPLANVNPSLVNVDNSSYSGGFGSTETSRQFSLNPTPISSIQAASASALQMGGGRRKKHHKTIKLRIKKIASKYKKMKGGKKMTLKSAKKQILSVINLIKTDNNPKSKSKKVRKTRKVKKTSKKHRKGGFSLGRAGGSRRRRHYQKGGTYHQYMGGIPNTPSYETGSVNLSPSESALANPVPFSVLPNNGSCVDNYNHFTNSGKQIW
jgi:hypothetical protein